MLRYSNLILSLVLLLFLSSNANAQISATTQLNSGGPFGTAFSEATVTFNGVNVVNNFAGLPFASFDTGCPQDVDISIQICNVEVKEDEEATVDVIFHDGFFNFVESEDFTFSGGPTGPTNALTYTSDFESTSIDQETGEVSCTTISLKVQIEEIFGVIISNKGFLEIRLNSESNVNTLLNIPNSFFNQANPVGENGTSTLLSSILDFPPNTDPGSNEFMRGRFPLSDAACSGALGVSYIISGELIVDVDYCFNNIRFFMEPGSSIRIINGANLVVDDRSPTIVLSDFQIPEFLPCETMWKGIIIEDGSLALNGATVTGAETSVTVQPNTSVSVTNSELVDNFIGVHFADVDNSPTPNNAEVLGFFSNTFSGTGELPPLYPGQTLPFFSPNDLPYAGVLAENYNLLPLLGTRFPTDLVPTKYSNMTHGIRFIDTDLNSSFSVFENIPNAAISGFSNQNNFLLHFGLNSNPSVSAGDEADFINCKDGILLGRMGATIEDSHFENIRGVGMQFTSCRNQSIKVKNNRISSLGNGVVSLFSHPLNGTIEENHFIPISIDGGTDILCFEGFDSSALNNPGNSWRITYNVMDGSQGGRNGIRISGGSNFEIKENIITRSGYASGINKYGIRLTNSGFPELDCNNIKVNGPNFGEDVGIMVRSAIFGEYECNSVDNFVNNIQFENDNMRNLFKGNEMSNGDQGLVFSSTAVLGTQEHKGNCWSNNNISDLTHANSNAVFVNRSLFTIKCQGEGGDNACGCDAVVAVQPGVSQTDLLLTDFFGNTESCGSQGDDDENGMFCANKKFIPGTPIEPEIINDRINNLVYEGQDADVLHWMSQFNMLRAIDNGMLTADGQTSEIASLRSENSELDQHLQFWDGLTSANSGVNQNIALADMFQHIHQLQQGISESTSEAEQADLQNQLDGLLAEFGILKQAANLTYQSNQESMGNVYNSFSFSENTNEIHKDYMAFTTNLYTDYMLNDKLVLDQSKEQLLYTIGTTCLDQAGPASNLAKALYYLVSDGVVLDSEECVEEIGERSHQLQKSEQVIKIFPNPTTGIININLVEDANIEIINQIGVLIKSFSLQSGSNRLNLDLPSGVYYIRDGKSFHQKFLITK